MTHIPLAERLRPKTLDELVGQEHLTGKGSILQQAIEQGKIPSLILWGPPGVGKTTIANIIAQQLAIPYSQLSAISSGVKEIREVIDNAKSTNGSLLFIDEIHRFNKGQQDALLGAVEKGIITLIGATTENPSFEVNSALLSRCQVYVLKSLSEANIQTLLEKAKKEDLYLKEKNIEIIEIEALVNISGGDARKLLNLFELVVASVSSDDPICITNDKVMKVAQQKIAIYDKQGEQHYNIISAFIKSMRGSDPNAAVYWLARMIEGGEDVKFIARRMLIFASEDIGNANPNALLLANSCFDAVAKIGYPESNLILSQCAIYLASSAKSRSACNAITKAQKSVRDRGDLAVPMHLRNAPTQLMKDLQYGKNHPNSPEFLPDQLKGTPFYEPEDNQREKELKQNLNKVWKGKYGY